MPEFEIDDLFPEFETPVAEPVPASAGEVIRTSQDTGPITRAMTQYQRAVDALVVSDQAGYEEAALMVKGVASAIKAAEKLFEDKDLAWKLYKSLSEKLNGFVKPLQGMRERIEGKMRAYKLAEAERIRRQQAELERQRQEEIAAETRKIAELAQQGRMQEARQVEAEVAVVAATPVVLPDRTTKVAGVSATPTFKGEVTDALALLKAVAAGTVAFNHNVIVRGKGEVRPLFIVDPVVLNHYVKLMGEKLDWPGVTVSPDIQFRSRG